MAVATIPVISREFVWVPVTAEGDDAAMLTTLPVEFAFLAVKPPVEPVDGDFHAGSWATTATSPTARCLVGSGGGVVLAIGLYFVWVRITGATERPVRFSGQLKIT